MRLNENEPLYVSEAMGSETLAQAVDAQAREAANAIREEGGQTDAETRTDAALALAFLDAMPKAWRAKADAARPAAPPPASGRPGQPPPSAAT